MAKASDLDLIAPGNVKNADRLFLARSELFSRPDVRQTETINIDTLRILSRAPQQVAFAWGDASPKAIITAQPGWTLTSAAIAIVQPFNGIASLQLGVTGDSDLFADPGSISPYDAGEYEFSPLYRFSSATNIVLTISIDGVSQGSGLISLEFNYG